LVVTDPSEGTCVVEPLPKCKTTTLFVPFGGALTNEMISAVNEYVVGAWYTPEKNTAIDAVPAGALVSVKFVVLALPENVSVMNGTV
jgi:hypothetical protein